MYNPAIFEDRIDAGKKLARKITKLRLDKPIVLAIPCGGVPVGIEIAQKLKCPLNLMILRKLQIPDNPEAGFGAVTADRTVILNPEIVPYLGLGQKEIDSVIGMTVDEIKRREKVFGVKKYNLVDKEVILVDDGLASGYTMLAAVQSIRKQKPKEIIIAIPTASAGAVQLIKPEVDRFICLYIHPSQLPFAVASYYKNWHYLEDDEVMCILKR